jgi:periplasmic protein TonB
MNNFFKTLIVAFFISLSIHLILYIIINKNLEKNTLNINTTKTKDAIQKNTLVKIKYLKVKKVEKREKQKEVIQPKTMPKKTSAKNSLKKSIDLIKLPVVKKEPLDLKKFFVIQKQEQIERQNQIQKAHEIQKEMKEIKMLPLITQSYIKLYGEEYFQYSKNQKKYLKENLNKIGQITQNYLRYPTISIRTQQKGTNVVEFYLHPNGDITDLELFDSSYYTALDDNTIRTIQIAYKDYPKPSEKVKIKIFVKYILYQ